MNLILNDVERHRHNPLFSLDAYMSRDCDIAVASFHHSFFLTFSSRRWSRTYTSSLEPTSRWSA